MPRVTIDGQPVDVTPGSNLLAAARKLGIDIPALCYFPGLPANTSCMACVVKICTSNGGWPGNGSPGSSGVPGNSGVSGSGGPAGAGRIVPACATRAADGMVVESETEEMRGLRRMALELLLSDHTGPCAATCPSSENSAPADGVGRAASEADELCVCGKESICRLRKYALAYGADPERFAGEKRALARLFEHPEITFDPGKCILCGICVQLARQAAESVGLTFVGRGFETRVDVPLGGELKEALQHAARRIAAACPTSALAPRKDH